MLYNSKYSDWTVAQYKDYSYCYIAKSKYILLPLDCLVSTAATSLKPIGPTILVEWEDDLH